MVLPNVLILISCDLSTLNDKEWFFNYFLAKHAVVCQSISKLYIELYVEFSIFSCVCFTETKFLFFWWGDLKMRDNFQRGGDQHRRKLSKGFYIAAVLVDNVASTIQAQECSGWRL